MEHIIDQINLENYIKKIRMYKEQEDLLFENFENLFKQLSFSYLTDNTDTLKEKMLFINNNNKKINVNNNSNIDVLNKNIDKYIATSNKTNQIFNNII